MTEAERSEARGFAIGLARGLAIAEARGVAKGMVMILLHVMQKKGLSLSADQRELIQQATDQPQILRWLDDVLEERSLDEVFQADALRPH